jgi:uncharacterized protein YbgA (DUF1722 family)
LLTSKKKRTVSYSFRLEEEWLKTLQEESNKQGISVNSLMNKILKRYSRHYRHMVAHNVIMLSHSDFAILLNSSTDDGIKEMARIIGDIKAKEILHQLGIPYKHEALMKYIEDDLGNVANWFNFTHHVEGVAELIMLQHDLGRKWSIFLEEAIPRMFKSILNEKVTSESSDYAVTLTLKRKDHEKYSAR